MRESRSHYVRLIFVKTFLCFGFLYDKFSHHIQKFSLFSFSVSLFGNSYINLPIQEAKSSTNIRLKFKTSLDSGLILATIGRIDYILLSVQEARLKLNLKIGDYKAEVS